MGVMNLETFSNLAESILQDWKVGEFEENLLQTSIIQQQTQKFIY